MKVLMIGTDRKIFEDGSAVQARILEYGKRVDRLDVVVFSLKSHELRVNPPAGGFELGNNVFLHPTNSISRWFYIFDAVRTGRHILKSTDFGLRTSDFVITTQDVFECGWVGKKLSQKFGIPLHVQIHTDFLSPYFKTNILNKIRVRIAQVVLPQADGIRVVSQRIANSLKAISYKLKAMPTVLPIFVDSEAIENAHANFDLRAKYPQFEKIILVVSRLEKEKCVDMAIDAFANVIKEFPKIGLVIVGDGSERRELEQQAISYKLKASVVFEGWQNDLNSYYKGSDIFLNTSLYEGYGMSIVEAGLNKLAIVTTDVGIVGDGGVLVDMQHAIVCPVGDIACMSEYLIRFLRDTEGARVTGLRAYTKLKELLPGTKEQYYDDITNDWRRLFIKKQ